MSPPPSPRRASRLALTAYAHPFELATLLLLGASAARVAENPDRLQDLAVGYAVTWSTLNGLGILLTAAGLLGSVDLDGNHPRRRALCRALEKSGLYLIAGTTAAYAVLLAGLAGIRAWDSVAQLAAIAAAALLRAGAIRRAEAITLEQLRTLREEDPDE